MKAPSIAVRGILLLFAVIGLAAVGSAIQKGNPGLRSAMPAGSEVIQLKPSRETLSLVGLIECPELEGARHTSQGLKARLIAANGSVLQEFPQHFSFRVTASLRKILLDSPLTSVNILDDPHELLLNLKFRVRAYHGLESREIVPESVEMIGMPADVPYDERVYRVHMNVGNLPISDRLVIEILSPEDELLTHFVFNLL